jgi:phosphate acetyltransferase
MNKAIYIATSEPNSGKSLVTLGLMRMLLGRTPKVGYFRPIIDDTKSNKSDNHINTVISYFDLDMHHDEAFALTRSEFVNMRNNDEDGKIIDTIIDKYKHLEEKFDFILVEGTDFRGEGLAIELDINILIAKNLGIPVLIVSSGIGQEMDEFIADVHIAYDSFMDKEVEVIAIVANKILKKNLKLVREGISKNVHKDVLVSAIPRVKSLTHPTLSEIVNALDAKVLFGEDYLNNPIESIKVGAMQLRHYLGYIENNSLIITPGDRADIILGALQANISVNYPKIAGIVLTGNIKPEKPILKLVEGLSRVVPIILTKEETYKIATKISEVKPRIYADNKQKIISSISTFEKYVDREKLATKFIEFETEGITPRMFQYNLYERAKKNRKHIVLPEGDDDRILKAAARLLDMDIVDLTILGDPEKIEDKSNKLNIDLKNATIINPLDSSYINGYAETFYELRKHKNVTMASALDIMTDVSYFGTMMVYKGDADGMVSGAAHTTQHTIRPALQFVKTKPGVSVVSSVFFMCLEDRVSVFGDCAINPNPNAEQLAEIAISSADSSLAFGIEPKIAMLSYSSGSSGKGEDVEKVRKATEIVKLKRPDLKIEGPIQYDAAVDMGVGKSKLPDSEVAGQASVLIFPDLNTGNNTYKAVQRETGALAIGPMLQGLNKPVNDLSRGCTVEDIFNTVIITAIQAHGL